MRKLILGILVLFILLGLALYSSLHSASNQDLKEAMYYQKLKDFVVQCHLCPRNCVIPDKKRGFCGVRENRGGVLYTLVYARPCAVHIDPIEKKPLFHVLPGNTAYSVATAGCNLRCKFCQNWDISQALPEEVESFNLSPQELVERAKKAGSRVIAYTYSEPTIFYEYMLDTAKIAKKEGLMNVMHSAGHINEPPLRELCKYLDAANIDLKGFSQDFYSQMSLGNLDSVLQTLKILKQEGVWVEITNLIVPGFNDDPEMIKNMCVWIKDNLGSDTPLHFSRFFPMYKLTNISPTPVETLERAEKIAKDAGLNYVYIGNIPGSLAESTFCPVCRKLIIGRSGYTITENNIENGKCKFCGTKIPGIWK
ncbi:MAG TPA: AmmeMemoRadiSam system radical SAM enzyme [Candidatus Omnitrophota bacterium]|nr:AmmeMemoRadiSam system radical SAM enzyme [Candidatus Omnitrophota bacterium]